MKAFLLAAGLGTRLLPFTKDRPKVMVKIGGRPVLEHLICLCAHHAITDIIINLHYLPKMITDYFGDGQRWGVKLTFSYEKARIMGGAGGLKVAEKWLKNERFFALNGDVMTNVNLTQMAKFHQQRRGLGTFLVHKSSHPYDSDLVEADTNGLIKRFFRPKVGDTFTPISKSGIHLFEPEVLRFIPQRTFYSLEEELIPDLLAKRQKFYAYYSDRYAQDMGTPERLEQVRRDYAQGKISV